MPSAREVRYNVMNARQPLRGVLGAEEATVQCERSILLAVNIAEVLRHLALAVPLPLRGRVLLGLLCQL